MKELETHQIVELASAFYGSAILFATLELGVYGAIESLGGRATLDEIAGRLDAPARGMGLLLNGAAAIGLLAKDGDCFLNTAAGRNSLVPGSKRDLTEAIKYNRDVYPLWHRLALMAKSGAPVEPPSVHLGEDAERTRRFALSMRGRAMAIGKSVLPMVDLEGAEMLLDLAGGPGAYAELFALKYPRLKCVTVDLPAISAIAGEFIRKAGLEGRIEARAGDYHSCGYEKEHYDAVTLFGCLHQESASDAAMIIQRAYGALKPGGKIFVLDMMTDRTHANPPFSALFGVNMALSMPNGGVFSDAEIGDMLRKAGFSVSKTVAAPPPMPHWLVSGVKQ